MSENRQLESKSLFDLIRYWSITDFEKVLTIIQGSKFLSGLSLSYHTSSYPFREGSFIRVNCTNYSVGENEDEFNAMAEAMKSRPLHQYNFVDDSLTDKSASLVNKVIERFKKEFEDFDIEPPGLMEPLQQVLRYIMPLADTISQKKGVPLGGPYTAEEIFSSPLIEYILGLPKRGLLPLIVPYPGSLIELQFITTDLMVEKLTRPSSERHGIIPGKFVAGDIELLDLSLAAQKTLFAILRLYTVENIPSDKWLQIQNKSALYEAANVKKTKRSGGGIEFAASGRRQIDNGLVELCNIYPDFIVERNVGDQKALSTIRQPFLRSRFIYREHNTGSIIQIAEQDEMDIPPTNSKLAEIEIMINPLLLEGATYFKQLPADLPQLIESYSKSEGGRASVYPLNFIIWLARHGSDKVRIGRDKLAKQLRIKAKGKAPMQAILENCYRTAKALGFLLGYKLDVPDRRRRNKLDEFALNPEKLPSLQDLIERKERKKTRFRIPADLDDSKKTEAEIIMQALVQIDGKHPGLLAKIGNPEIWIHQRLIEYNGAWILWTLGRFYKRAGNDVKNPFGYIKTMLTSPEFDTSDGLFHDYDNNMKQIFDYFFKKKPQINSPPKRDTAKHHDKPFAKYGDLGFDYSIDISGYLKVTKVEPNSPAHKGGVKQGDLIEQIGQTHVYSMPLLNKEEFFNQCLNGRQDIIFILRNDKHCTAIITLEP